MRMKSIATVAGAILAVTAYANDVVNPGFEDLNEHGWPAGWMKYGPSTCKVVTDVVRSGKRALFCDATDRGTVAYGRCAGARQYVNYGHPDRTPVHFGVWTKGEDVYCGRDWECCLSVGYDDGTWDFADCSIKFGSGTKDWTLGQHVFYPKKPVRQIILYSFVRKGYGKAWFDDAFIERRDPGEVPMWEKRFTMRPFADEDVVLRKFPKGLRRETVPADPKTAPLTTLEPNDVCVWSAPATRKVTPLTFPTGEELAATDLRLEAPRRGSASGQVLVSTGSNGARRGVRIEVGELKASDGTVLKGRVKWERVGYVERQPDAISHPTAPAPGEHWLPDALLPAAPFDVRNGGTQAIWLTAAADADARPGVYRGAVRVLVPDKDAQVLPVELTVHAVTLPATFGMRTSVSMMEPFVRRFYPEDFRERTRQLQDLMLDHRLNADNISRWEVPDVEDVRHAVSRGANLFNVLALLEPPKDPDRAVTALWPDPNRVREPAYMDYLRTTLKPFVEKLRAEGLMKYAYLYGFDERNQEHYKGIDATWKALKAEFPDLPVMTTARMYKDMALAKEGTNFPYAVTTDWYCPLTSVWKRDLTAQLHALGKEVWWYTCCGPLYPFANFASIEEPYFESQILAWQTWLEKADGFLFWSVNWWVRMPRADERDTFLAGKFLDSDLQVQGDGILTYPGKDGIYPSIRLAALRDGVQDYELLQLAAAKLGREKVEKLGAAFIRGPDDFDRDPQALLAARRRLYEKLEE